MSERTVRVLVLTSSTGGGHDSRARALRDWMKLDASGVKWEVELHQALEESHGLYRFGVGLYNFIQRIWPGLHHIYYNVLEGVSFCGGGEGSVMGREAYTAVVRRVKPDLVLSTHDHLNHGFFAVAREAMPDAPPKCVTYCTELQGGYGFSRHWVNPRADLFIAAVPEVAEQARKLGMAPEKIFVGGFLLHPAFWAPRDPAADAQLAREIGLQPGRFTLLLSTGANSAQNHIAWLDALAAAGPLPAPLQVVALCGSDESARKLVLDWAARHPQFPVFAQPKLPHLAQLLGTASAIIARPGTGTTTEAILSGVPILFNTLGGIMPQEIITVKFCREHGFSQVLRRPADLVNILRGWLASPEALAAEKTKVAAACPTASPLDIVRRLRELLGVAG